MIIILSKIYNNILWYSYYLMSILFKHWNTEIKIDINVQIKNLKILKIQIDKI